MTDPFIGQTFERYQIVSPVGSGQWGTVYKAFDPNLQRDVAIKLIHLPEGHPGLAEALARQARAAAQLDQPGVIKIHDFGQAGPWLHVVMDYIPGGNLAQWLQDLRGHNQWLPLAEAIGVVRQLALALDALGRQGLAARGISPADVMLRPAPFDGQPFQIMLSGLDFQPALAEAAGSGALNPAAAAPAYAYWSPEQALGEPLTAHSEVYSLGTLLNELAVGRQPFPAQNQAEALRLHTQTAPPAPRSRRADLPAALEAIILQALEKDPARRYADPGALAQALAGVLPEAAEVDRNPANSAGTVSLLVPYQRSLSAAPATAPAGSAPLTSGDSHKPEERAFFRFNGAVVDANLVQTSPDGTLGVYMEVPQFTVTPGQPTSTGIVVVNLGPAQEHVSLSANGLPAGWLAAPLPPTSVPLAAGESRRMTFTIAPPQAPASRAGRYTLVLRAVKQSQPDQAVEAKLGITVAAYSQFQSELTATTIEAGQLAHLQVHNQGNVPETFTVNFDDAATRVFFDPPDMNFTVPEGQMGVADFVVRRRGTRLVGDQRVYPFGVRVTASTGQSQGLTAEVVTHALVPPWLMLLAVFGCCLITGASALAFGGLRQQAAATSTAAAQQTSNAIANGTISAMGTALATQGTATPTATGSATLEAPTTTGTLLPATATLTAAPVIASDTAQPPAASGTPVPASETPVPPTDTATALPPSPTETALPPTPTMTLTLAPPASTTAAPAAGGSVVYVSGPANQPNLFRINGDGSNTAPLTTDGNNQHPAWSAAAQRMVFESTRDGNSEIYSMKADGSEQNRLTNAAGDDTSAVWSTDGTHIAFVSNRDGNPEIYVMNADGSSPTRLTNNTSADTLPAWSPDNAHLAFIATRDGNPELYIMDANGGNQTRLTNDPDPEDAPAWAPNGAWLAYVRGTGNAAEIYLTTAQGSGQLQLTNNTTPDTQPRWAPNASRLAFVSERDGNPEIYTMLADGSAQTRLTNSAGRDDNPVWSPLGDRIAFASDRDGVAQIYYMNQDGSAQTRLTNDGVADQPDVWLP